MRSMVQLDAFLVRYVIMNRLKKKERERHEQIQCMILDWILVGFGWGVDPFLKNILFIYS